MSTAVKPVHSSIRIIYNGEEKEESYRPSETVKVALEKALDLYDITANRHIMALYTAAGVELANDDLSLEAAGVKAGDELTLGQSKVKGG